MTRNFYKKHTNDLEISSNTQLKKLYWDLFSTFFKIGLFTIGGGYAMIPFIEAEIIEKHKWLKREDFLDMIAIAQSLPGIFAINISIFIGYKLEKKRGALCAMLGCVLPSFIIVLSLAIFFSHFREYPVVERIFMGIRPAVVALIATPVFKMARNAKVGWTNAWIPVVSALLIWLCGVSPIYIIIIAAVGGYLYGKITFKTNQ